MTELVQFRGEQNPHRGGANAPLLFLSKPCLPAKSNAETAVAGTALRSGIRPTSTAGPSIVATAASTRLVLVPLCYQMALSSAGRFFPWRAQAVQHIVADKAHRDGVRVRRVCAWNTSKLAFDGSGEVERDKHNYSMCTFKTGKRYHCDLSASYNIGARYFIREILKSLPAKARLGIEAKVPQCTKRTTCTLSTLLSLNAELMA